MKRITLPAAIFAGVGVIMLAATVITLWFALRPLRWPPVIATVTSSRVLGDQNGMYRAERGFRYSLGGRDYTVLDSATWSSSSYTLVQSEVAEFPEGAQREIRIHPGDPTHISTTTRVTFTTLLAPIILFTLTLVFGGIGLWQLLPSMGPRRRVLFSRTMSPEEVMNAARSQGKFPARLFGWVFIPVGVVFLTIGGVLIKEQVEESRWPRVTAEVTRNDTRVGRRRSVMYTPWIEFRYVAGAREYVTPTSGAIWTSSQSSVEETLRHYSPGSRHEIRYDPEHPEIVRYLKPMSFSTLFLPAGMLMGAMVFIGFGIVIPRVFRDM